MCDSSALALQLRVAEVEDLQANTGRAEELGVNRPRVNLSAWRMRRDETKEQRRTKGIATLCDRLFKAQRDDGIDTNRATCWNPAGSHGHEDEERRSHEETRRIEGTDSEKQSAHASTEDRRNPEA